MPGKTNKLLIKSYDRHRVDNILKKNFYKPVWSRGYLIVKDEYIDEITDLLFDKYVHFDII